MKSRIVVALVLLIPLLTFGCERSASPRTSDENVLVGAWRAKVKFKSGALAEINDLEFMYVFNLGGTMTESSNYDGSPPVPPAYGVWRKTGPRQFEARYAFYATKPPSSFEELTKSGWTPAGHGVLMQRISLSPDAKSYTSAIRFDLFDTSGVPIEGGGEGAVEATRMDF